MKNKTILITNILAIIVLIGGYFLIRKDVVMYGVPTLLFEIVLWNIQRNERDYQKRLKGLQKRKSNSGR